MDELDMELLSDMLYRLYNELEDGMMFFLGQPYKYSDEIVDEVINIVDRIETLQAKMNDIDFKGSFKYDRNTTT